MFASGPESNHFVLYSPSNSVHEVRVCPCWHQQILLSPGSLSRQAARRAARRQRKATQTAGWTTGWSAIQELQWCWHHLETEHQIINHRQSKDHAWQKTNPCGRCLNTRQGQEVKRIAPLDWTRWNRQIPHYEVCVPDGTSENTGHGQNIWEAKCTQWG